MESQPPVAAGTRSARLQKEIRGALFKWVFLVAVLGVSASAGVVTRAVLMRGVAEPATLVAVRNVSSAIFAGLFWVLLGRKDRTPAWSHNLILMGLLLGLQTVLLGLASNLTTASMVGFFFFGCSSITATLAGIVLKRRISLYQAVGILVGLIGLIIVMKPHGQMNAGVLLAAIGGTGWGFYVLWSKHKLPGHWLQAMKVSSYPMFIAAVTTSIYAVFTEPHGLTETTAAGWIAGVYLGLFPQALGFVALGWIAGRLNHFQLGVTQFGTPILIVLGSTLLLGEKTSWDLWGGLALVIAGMVFASKR